MIVHRAEAAGIRPYEMEQALQVPHLEIKRMLRAAPPPDPWRTEMKELIHTLRVEALMARIQGSPFPGPHTDKHKRLRVMVSMTESQLNGVIELAPPEAIARRLQTIEARRSDEAVVQAYFDLLRHPPDGVLPFLSPNHEGATRTKRMPAGFRAVSRALKDLGLIWLDGHAPTVQRARLDVEALVAAELSADPDLAARLEPLPDPEIPFLPAVDRTFIEAPPRSRRSETSSLRESRPAQRWVRSASDQANTELGRRGEEFVIEVEHRRLVNEGRPDLAKCVEWTAQDKGDGAGYDVASFNADGSPRLIEVKTTNGAADTPFFVAANEIRVSSARPGDYWLYRVYNFAQATRAIYTLRGALDGEDLILTPTVYRATR